MQEQRAPSNIAIATKYGLITGVLGFVVFLARAMAGIQHNWVASAVSIVVLIALMALAHQEFKRTHGGRMTYGQGLGSGTWFSAVAALVQAVFLYVYTSYINTGYIATTLRAQQAAQQAALARRGITGDQAQHAMALTASFMTPVAIAVLSLIVGVIGGFIVALIVSMLTQNSEEQRASI